LDKPNHLFGQHLRFAVIFVTKAFMRTASRWIIAGSSGRVALSIAVALVFLAPAIGFTGSPAQRPLEKIPSPEDTALPLRQQASQMADTLVHCGFSREEACDIALNDMPGLKDVEWWKREVLPRVAEEYRRPVEKELERSQNLAQHSDRDAVVAYLSEIAIWRIIERERHFSATKLFDLWQAGIVNQSDDWWNAQIDGLSTAKRDEVNKLRQRLTESHRKTSSPGTTSNHALRVGESYNDVEAELKARHASYRTGSFDKDHRFLIVGHGQIVATFHGDIAIAIISRFKEPLTEAELKDIRGEGNWNLVVPGTSWVRSTDGVMFVYNPKDYTVSLLTRKESSF
jgi:hypothetical protein